MCICLSYCLQFWMKGRIFFCLDSGNPDDVFHQRLRWLYHHMVVHCCCFMHLEQSATTCCFSTVLFCGRLRCNWSRFCSAAASRPHFLFPTYYCHCSDTAADFMWGCRFFWKIWNTRITHGIQKQWSFFCNYTPSMWPLLTNSSPEIGYIVSGGALNSTCSLTRYWLTFTCMTCIYSY